MTGTTRSSSGLDDRRKRLLFRCWHRGTREMDLILGRFADAEIVAMRDDELAELERLIELPDPDLYAALIGGKLQRRMTSGLIHSGKSGSFCSACAIARRSEPKARPSVRG